MKIYPPTHWFYLLRANVRFWLHERRAEKELRPGQFYEDCGFHPSVCYRNDGGAIEGVSLIDGLVRGCDLYHCGVLIFDNVKEARDAAQRYKDLGRDAYIDAVMEERLERSSADL